MYALKPGLSDTCVIRFTVLYGAEFHFMWQFMYVLSLCRPTPCLFQRKILLPVQVLLSIDLHLKIFQWILVTPKFFQMYM